MLTTGIEVMELNVEEITYLPEPPALIELDMRALFPEDYEVKEEEFAFGSFDEFQMKAEMTAVRESMKRKNQRLRHHRE